MNTVRLTLSVCEFSYIALDKAAAAEQICVGFHQFTYSHEVQTIISIANERAPFACDPPREWKENDNERTVASKPTSPFSWRGRHSNGSKSIRLEVSPWLE